MIEQEEVEDFEVDPLEGEEEEGETSVGGGVSLPPLDPDDPDYLPQVYRTDRELAVIAPTHVMSPKVSFEDIQRHYKQNPRKAKRDYLCVASTPSEPFFRDPDILDLRVNEERKHPFTVVEIVSVRGRDNYLTRFLRSDFRPVPGKVYWAHVDLSKCRDATGIGLAHWDKHLERYVDGVGKVVGQIVLDLMIRIIAPPQEDINYAGIREFFWELKVRGFAIRCISFDQFNSIEMMQELQKKGFATDDQSVVRTTDAYDTLQEMMVLGKLDYYPYEPFRQECRSLILKPNGRVDHAPGGKSDVADGAAGSVYLARLFAGQEVYAESGTVSRAEAAKSVSPEDERYREELLGFREVASIW